MHTRPSDRDILAHQELQERRELLRRYDTLGNAWNRLDEYKRLSKEITDKYESLLSKK